MDAVDPSQELPAVHSQLDQFLALACPRPFDYEACHHFPGRGAHQTHAVLGFVVHGDEIGSLPAALRLQAELLARPPAGPVTLLLGNVAAARAGVRFLQEDLNRVFTFDRPAESSERRRAAQVQPVLDVADVFFDFHQTAAPCAMPFWTMPWTRELGLWARALAAAKVGLTRRAEQPFSPGLRCLDEYVRDRGKVGITVELGQKGADPAQAAACYEAARRLLDLVDSLGAGETTLREAAERQPDVDWFVAAYIVRSQPPELRLRQGLQNWSPLVLGENLALDGTGEERCPVAGFALFPKYPAPGEPAPPELLRIAQAVDNPTLTFGN